MNKMLTTDALAIQRRLKSFSEQLYQEESRLYKKLGINCEARWIPILQLLHRSKEALAITEIARLLQKTHPAINQLTNQMIEKELLDNIFDEDDKRRRLVDLSAKGEALVADLRPLWEVVEGASQNWLKEVVPDFLLYLDMLEDSLQEQSFYDRVMSKKKELDFSKTSSARINFILGEEDRFRELNLNWIQKYLGITDSFAEILKNPKMVLNKNGEILMGKIRNEIVGTCTLKRHSYNVCELMLLCVDEKFQGNQLGNRLIHDAFIIAKALGCVKMILHTSRELKPAMKLFQKMGFQYTTAFKDFQPDSALLRVTMVKEL